MQPVSNADPPRAYKPSNVVRFKSIVSLSVQKSGSIVEFCAAAQVGVSSIRSGDLGGGFVELRLIQFDNASQARVIAVLCQSQSLLALRDESRSDIQTAIGFIGAIPAVPYLLANLKTQFIRILCSRIRFQLRLRLPCAIRTAIEDWNVEIESGRRIVVMQGAVMERNLSSRAQDIQRWIAQPLLRERELGRRLLTGLRCAQIRALRNALRQ